MRPSEIIENKRCCQRLCALWIVLFASQMTTGCSSQPDSMPATSVSATLGTVSENTIPAISCSGVNSRQTIECYDARLAVLDEIVAAWEESHIAQLETDIDNDADYRSRAISAAALASESWAQYRTGMCESWGATAYPGNANTTLEQLCKIEITEERIRLYQRRFGPDPDRQTKIIDIRNEDLQFDGTAG